MDTVINLENISKTFYIREQNNDSIRDKFFNMFDPNAGVRALKALEGINLQIKKGEFFGIVGHNGSGKSTLLKLIMGAFPPDPGGKITTKGKMIRLALGMGFDPTLTAKENIYVNGSVLGMSFREIGSKFDEIIAFAELEDFVDTPIKFYSTGMRSRLSFAIAVNAQADIFLMDEFFGGVGDIAFREKSKEVFEKNQAEGRTIIHVSHNLSTLREHCERVLLINKGKQIMIGTPDEVLPVYKDLFNKKPANKAANKQKNTPANKQANNKAANNQGNNPADKPDLNK